MTVPGPVLSTPSVTALGHGGAQMTHALTGLLARFGIALNTVTAHATIPGTFWGEPEAGLIDTNLYARADTPVHSVLHEACHYICMDSQRRKGLHTNAGGTAIEECAVCYFSVLLADELTQYSRQQMLTDMDRWGYSFRLGSSQAWFENDADDAVRWLRDHGLIDQHQSPTWKIRAMAHINGPRNRV